MACQDKGQCKECVSYNAFQQGQVKGIIRDLVQVCRATCCMGLAANSIAGCRCSIPVLSHSPEGDMVDVALLPMHDCSC